METQSVDEAEVNPVSFMKNQFADKLNEYYETRDQENQENQRKTMKVDVNDIMFTDWLIEGDELTSGKEFGLCGVSDVKRRIWQYLVKFGIYKDNEKDKMEVLFKIVNTN